MINYVTRYKMKSPTRILLLRPYRANQVIISMGSCKKDSIANTPESRLSCINPSTCVRISNQWLYPATLIVHPRYLLLDQTSHEYRLN